jgi:acyl carrier protein
MTQEEVANQVRDFIQQNFIFDDRKVLEAQESLIESGTIDSTGVLELIGFLEKTYHVRFEDQELVAENFDSVGKVSAFVFRKLNA